MKRGVAEILEILFGGLCYDAPRITSEKTKQCVKNNDKDGNDEGTTKERRRNGVLRRFD